MKTCDTLINNDLIYNFRKMQNITGNFWYTNDFYKVTYNIFDLLMTLTRFTQQLHPIVFNCYNAGENVYNHYANIIINTNGYNVKPYILNFIYAFGNIYECFRDVYIFF
jgi:hypothetical protein